MFICIQVYYLFPAKCIRQFFRCGLVRSGSRSDLTTVVLTLKQIQVFKLYYPTMIFTWHSTLSKSRTAEVLTPSIKITIFSQADGVMASTCNLDHSFPGKISLNQGWSQTFRKKSKSCLSLSFHHSLYNDQVILSTGQRFN